MWEKIVLNLLSNAFKFTLDGEIESRSAASGRRASFVVRDTGVGILRSSSRTSSSGSTASRGSGQTHEGTGIGLALVQELANLHSGTVEVESVRGKGTTFSVTIPLGRAHPLDEAMPGTSAADPSSLGARHYVEECSGGSQTRTASRRRQNRLSFETSPYRGKPRIRRRGASLGRESCLRTTTRICGIISRESSARL